ncbi:MAG: PDZ domain-containing protein [Planctomycetota bacterium]|jgi:membrane-associated protease RseP (regulator of RpoE activity)
MTSGIARICAPALLLAALTAGAGAAEAGTDPVAPAAREKTYGFLGVAVRPVSGDLAEHLGLDDGRGLIIAAVTPDSAAEKAGLAAGDVVVKVDDQVIYGSEQFAKLIAAKRPGTEVSVARIRKGQPAAVKVELGSTTTPPRPGGLRGLEFTRPLGGREWRKRMGEVVPPAAVLRFRLPDEEGWKVLTPDAENWKEQVGRVLESLKGTIPDEALGKLKEQMERARARIEERRQKALDEVSEARRQAAEAVKIDPQVVVEGAGPGENKLTASTTVTAEQGGYRANWRKDDRGEVTISLYRKDGEAVFEDLPEKELAARMEKLEPAARKLLGMIRKTATIEIRLKTD